LAKAEISLAHVLVIEKRSAVAGQLDFSVDHDVCALRQLKRMIGILFDQENRLSHRRDLRQNFEDPLHDKRREAERRLIEQYELGLRHQRTRNGKHLLLAAGHGSSGLIAAFLQPREKLEHRCPIFIEMRHSDRRGAHHQIFLNAHVLINLAALRNKSDAAPRNLVGGQLGDVFATVADLA
jgi:ABC-type methionine transport system ATPase subunit